ncbi:predicted protein [Sclerotinia sclerotiorum 1980 UF-70]|uniref:Uncharacterized protein n=1 Tax=Sclerotinia sclerotiorum (strain ATCC 18683 / 1980 / Ss-1) TaxID=665079 RepID=A7E7U1_SCLS1|nr:predicted protein [Sclerotinia sclerotiorum 1980 UF-70]EDN96443.1 predicted protein [Sclerotinia sclerotiorum 1980 UF-70]
MCNRPQTDWIYQGRLTAIILVPYQKNDSKTAPATDSLLHF